MSNIPAVLVTGVSGRMGQMLVKLINKSDKLKLAGATERKGHDWIGLDLGEMLGGSPSGTIVQDSVLELISDSNALIDFTTPSATIEHAELAAQARVAHIIGTTGMSKNELKKISAAARQGILLLLGLEICRLVSIF